MQKINSIHFGGLWLGIGGGLLVAFGIIFIIEMHQASGIKETANLQRLC